MNFTTQELLQMIGEQQLEIRGLRAMLQAQMRRQAEADALADAVREEPDSEPKAESVLG